MERVYPAALPPRAETRGVLRAELRATLSLALPLAAANLAQTAMSVTTTVMVGRLGAVPLAAAGLGGMLFFTAGVVLQGVLFAVAPLAAHAFGAGERAAAGRIAGAGLALAALLSAPLVALLLNFDRLLAALGYDPELAAEIGRYLAALAWGAPAFLGFAVLRSLVSALAHTRAVMAVILVCVALNVLFNWVLVFGRLGVPALEVAGAGYANAAAQWLMFSGLALCLKLMRRFRGLFVVRGVAAARVADFADILRLGLPIGAIRGIEAGLFATTGVLMGLLGAAALGAHQIVINCASVSFMVPLGLGQTATVRVAHELGAGRPAAARRAAIVALALGVGFMAVAATIFWTLPLTLIGIYLNLADPANAATIAIARRLIAIAALFQVFDGMQVIAAGALRGWRDTLVPMLLAAFGYWGIGFAGAWLLAFPLGFGPVGLWWGLALGLAAVAFLLTRRLHRLAAPPSGRVAALLG